MTLIEHQNGNIYDFDKDEIRTLNFDIESPNFNHNFSEIENGRGVIDNGSYLKTRKIIVSFFAESTNVQTFSLLRDEIFEMVRSEHPFYITEQRSTNKRWVVKVDSSYNIPQVFKHGKFDIPFISLRGVAESRKTTLDLEREGIVNDNTWSYGMGLETTDDSELKYVHTGKTFKIFNAGNVEVHPFESDLNIEIKNVIGSSTNFEMVNRTNNSRFKINKQVASSDVWKINGPVIKRNSLMATRDTTKTFISLEPGWNHFEILGADSATVSFDFKFLYL
ncbi:phage tail family protein [Vagococcus carniphilus]|uniref:phage tail domain-containing protein n=1 Tax=Vagococcus carniphilus TaxID=218144 RepID=UPI002890DA61|nr:phage tail domain-containing protein [Vagococcus carniphilus]MDT2848757.1 phage tail family protein [Vagococcus carniphilus]